MNSGPLKYMPQLDGLRTFAIASVLMSHFLRQEHPVQQVAHWGRIGVLLFFVLSGFLITGILLDAKGSAARGRVARTFYARRFLRIFPIYYLTLVLVCVLNPTYRPTAWWHFLYLGNMASAEVQRTFQGGGHLWTLAVEEQFYLLWPALVLLVPTARLRYLLAGLIGAAFAYKTAGGLLGVPWDELSRPLYANLDSLGAGALLAVCSREKQSWRMPGNFWTWLAVFGGIQAFRGYSTTDVREMGLYLAPADLSIAIFSGYLVLAAARGSQGIFGRLLALAPMRYVGKISYGMYLFHLFILFELPHAGFWTLTAMTLVLAMISWHVFEGPINSLKSRFSYRERGAEVKASEASAPA